MNMYVLNSFGPIVEAILGPRRFLTFFVVAGIFSSFCHGTVSALLLGKPDLPALGASGAISGLILFFSLLFPREKILLLGFIPMPALFGALAFIGLDIAGLMAQAEGGGLPIGHGAHLGGAFAGIIFYFMYRRRLFAKADPALCRTNGMAILEHRPQTNSQCFPYALGKRRESTCAI